MLLYLLPLLVPALGQDDPLVTTADGPVKGSYKFSQKGTRYRSFQGIPFAAPPVGPLRFAPPQPADPWEDVLDVSGETTIECPQYDSYGTPATSLIGHICSRKF